MMETKTSLNVTGVKRTLKLLQQQVKQLEFDATSQSCRKKDDTKTTKLSSQNTSYATRRYSKEVIQQQLFRPILMGKMNGEDAPMLIDTGSERCFINEEFYDRIKTSLPRHWSCCSVIHTASGAKIIILVGRMHVSRSCLSQRLQV